LTALLWRLKRGEVVGYDGFKHRKGTKIHAVVDPSSKPLYFTVGPGNEHDSRRLQEPVDGLSERPKELYADAAYDTENIRSYLSSMGVEPNIPVNPRNGRRPRPYNVERFFRWLKSFRRIVIGYERLAVTYRAFINIACIMIHLRHRG
jgi:transposase